MKKSIVMVVWLLAIGLIGQAQPYKHAIGLRLSNSYYDIVSASYKFHISTPGAIELNAGIGGRSYIDRVATFNVAGAYQHHFEIPVEGLRWFVGGGGDFYIANSDYSDYDGAAFGLFITGGIDYKIPTIPLNVSADFRPTAWLTRPGYYKGFYPNAGISARYVLGQR